MKVYLIRHGRTEDALAGIHQHPESKLIKDLVDPSLYSHLKPEKVYSSPYPRAKETAEILFGSFEVVPHIHEYIRSSSWDGKPRDFGWKFFQKHLPAIRKDPNWTHGGSESFNDVIKRAKKFERFLRKLDHSKVAVVSHGTFIKIFMGHLDHGKNYNFSHYEDIYWPMEWKNLIMKEITI